MNRNKCRHNVLGIARANAQLRAEEEWRRLEKTRQDFE